MSDIILGAFADEANGWVDNQITAMLENGIKNLEARMVDGKSFVDCTVEEARAIKAKLDAHDLRVWSIGSPLGKIDVTAPMEPHLDYLKHTLELAEVMGSERIRMFSFFIPKDEDPAIYRDEVMDRLNRMVEVARGTGVKLCHENEKGIYGENAARCRDILDTIPELGGIFDPANFIQCGQDTLEAWDLLADRIDYFHVKDCLEGGKVVPCGKGVGHVPEIIKKFIAGGGTQLTVEPHLTVFDGLASLEREGEKTQIDEFAYPSKRAAFDVAVAALKESLG